MSPLALQRLKPPQKQLWERLGEVPEYFVLYGGTALALQLDHRDSEDFDLFTSVHFSPEELAGEIPFLANRKDILKKADTLTAGVLIGTETVQCSFSGGLQFQRIEDPSQASNGLAVAGIRDIFASKCVTLQAHCTGPARFEGAMDWRSGRCEHPKEGPGEQET